MEINKWTDIVGAVAVQDMVEGRMVLLTPNIVSSYDFGSRDDLPGVKLPATAAEAAKAKFCVAFALDNRPTPIIGYPAMTYALRKGFDQAVNTPFSATVYTTHPSNSETPQTITSGSLALAFDKGVFTVTSGNFIASASLVTGAFLSVNYAGANAGMLQYSASADVAVVEKYDSTNFLLTFRTL